MKVGIVMTIKDRKKLTEQSLEYLFNSYLPNDGMIVLVDDGSTEMILMPKKAKLYDIKIIRHSLSLGIRESLKEGIQYCFDNGCEIVTNLDNDVKLKQDWLQITCFLYSLFEDRIVTGFHSVTNNRHEIVDKKGTFCLKKSVGGINMLFNKSVYEKYIKPALESSEGNWDNIACQRSYADGHPIVASIPSLIQHTGIGQSSMGHTKELPDVAADWIELELPDVVLIGVDCNHFDQLERAAWWSTMEIKFGAVRLLTSGEISNPHAYKIAPLTSKEDYNEFVVKQLYKFCDKDKHLLIIQGDGYVVNPEAWQNNFLDYDYLGATWLYKDNMNVGNGGFSLRSFRFHEAIANDDRIINTYPEDHQLCRTYRPYLQSNYGFKYAPENVANEFSIEAYGSNAIRGANKYNGQFGFHGWNVDFSDWHGHRPNMIKQVQKPRKSISDIWEGMA